MRTVTTYYHDVDTKNGGLSLELPQPMSFVMEYKDVLVKETAETITIGYLVDDSDCGNPLEDCDGMGSIYDCRRHSSTLGDYEKALGLCDGGPDLDQVPEEDVVAEALRRILNDPADFDRVLTFCCQRWDRTDEDDEDFIRGCLDSINELDPIFNTDALLREMWAAGRTAGTIGNKYAVMVDYFEHGQCRYSVNSGGGADWDTARGGAVWVPDECAREELLRRAPVYRKGRIIENRLRSKTQVNVRTYESSGRFDDTVHPNFEHWHEAFDYLNTLTPTYEQPMEDAERDAARELASQACSVYTDWRNGNCFGVVTATYSLEGDEIDHDSCYGFIGDDDAYSSLKHDYFPKD